MFEEGTAVAAPGMLQAAERELVSVVQSSMLRCYLLIYDFIALVIQYGILQLFTDDHLKYKNKNFLECSQ